MTDPRVDVIIARTIDQFEGGFVNDPDDPGGATNFGITIADLRRWRKQPTTPDDVRAMTRDTAIQIYWVYYWNAPNIGALPDELQPVVFDAGVNLGPGALYGAITRLEERGLIEPLSGVERRRPYRITEAGSKSLATAVADMRRLVDVSTTRLRLAVGGLS